MQRTPLLLLFVLVLTDTVLSFDRGSRKLERRLVKPCDPNKQCVDLGSEGCCGIAEECISSKCCPVASIVNERCCHPLVDDTCCPTNSQSRCKGFDGVEYCVNNEWTYQKCPLYQTCAHVPVANGGYYCQGASPFCSQDGEPSRCLEGGKGFQKCVNGRWETVECQGNTFCLGFPVEGAGVACVGPPSS